ncbi:MAG: cytochrome c family protein [Proteobacteria bacterium]|nr:cytochrome c family protein [Pseudomonadota bacterium]
MKQDQLITLRCGPLAVAGAIVTAVAALAAASVYAATASPPHPGDPVRGKTVYQGCMGCHSLDEDDVGPHHRGVVGRTAGSVSGYAYSPALKNSHIVWDRANLDRWLTSPQGLVPGAKMFFALPNPQDRADVIAYLAEQR